MRLLQGEGEHGPALVGKRLGQGEDGVVRLADLRMDAPGSRRIAVNGVGVLGVVATVG